jgi:DNA (cytosine-5)-methyltransferase 1
MSGRHPSIVLGRKGPAPFPNAGTSGRSVQAIGHDCGVPPLRPRVLSLYTGAGGLDLGFAQAGFELAWANERDPHACRTYAHNLGEHIIEGDLLSVELPCEDFDVVVGGPPCQGWSRIGRMDPHDPRSEHVHRFLDVVEAVRPIAFVMENVANLAEGARWQSVREALLSRATNELGFRAEMMVLDASHYGVPQARRRVFFVGIRGAIPCRPPRASPELGTVRATLARLPPYGDRGNSTICRARVVPARQPVLRPSAYLGGLLFNGSGRPLYLDAPARTLPASMGGNATPILDQLELDEGAAPWVVEYHERLLAGGRPLRRAPKRMRRITVEEAAALQSFPPSFKFSGSTVAQYRQIGNAVPPTLARAVARMLIRQLRTLQDRASPALVA